MSDLKIFYGMFQNEQDVKASIPVIKAIKRKYPESSIVFATTQALILNLVGVSEISEIIPVKSPGDILVMGYGHDFDRIFIPMITNQEQANWASEGKWLKRAPNNTLSHYYAERCLDDIVLDPIDFIIVPEVKLEVTSPEVTTEA